MKRWWAILTTLVIATLAGCTIEVQVPDEFARLLAPPISSEPNEEQGEIEEWESKEDEGATCSPFVHEEPEEFRKCRDAKVPELLPFLNDPTTALDVAVDQAEDCFEANGLLPEGCYYTIHLGSNEDWAWASACLMAEPEDMPYVAGCENLQLAGVYHGKVLSQDFPGVPKWAAYRVVCCDPQIPDSDAGSTDVEKPEPDVTEPDSGVETDVKFGDPLVADFGSVTVSVTVPQGWESYVRFLEVAEGTAGNQRSCYVPMGQDLSEDESPECTQAQDLPAGRYKMYLYLDGMALQQRDTVQVKVNCRGVGHAFAETYRGLQAMTLCLDADGNCGYPGDAGDCP